jgi:hypothetical protein
MLDIVTNASQGEEIKLSNHSNCTHIIIKYRNKWHNKIYI